MKTGDDKNTWKNIGEGEKNMEDDLNRNEKESLRSDGLVGHRRPAAYVPQGITVKEKKTDKRSSMYNPTAIRSPTSELGSGRASTST